uniref:Cadherin domain-containing protein n=1 Tax=Esox lucius TaxID=8010 RepID=A0A3P9ABK6_ESOLU
MAIWCLCYGFRWLVLLFFLYFSHSVSGQIRYSIPEELKKGSLIGNVAQDLGLDLKRLRAGGARIVTGESVQYTELKTDKGILVVSERIDREQLCGDVTPCSFSFEIILENPMELNVTVNIFIQDQNDNAPQVLYPVQTSSSLVAEMVPRSADVGYLVTKVVAVDVDSGQNAWLSYKLQKTTDRALFEVGLQNGEIRTIRQVTDKDAVKQRLTVVVEDNGQPSRSATVNVNVAVADSFPEVLSEFTDFTHKKEYNDNLTFYLVLALAVVSFLFITCLVVIISVKIYRWRQSRILYHSNLPVIPYYPPRYADTLGTGTLQHVYNYEVCRTTDSRKSDCKFSRPGSQNVVIMDPSSTGTMQRMQSGKTILDEPDSPIEVCLFLSLYFPYKNTPLNLYFVPWMCIPQISINCKMLSYQYGPTFLKNAFSTLLNQCHVELRQF